MDTDGEELRDMKVLVTGGAGYIGSHTVAALLREGHEVHVYDNLSTGHRRAVPPAAQFILGDIRDGSLLTRVLADKGIEAVIHFAARLVVPESMENPWDYYETNTWGGLQVIKSCLNSGVQSLIFSSTAAVYGEADQPVKESDPKKPVNPYGASKLMMEQLLEQLNLKGPRLRWVSLRYFNVAGAAMDGSNGSRTENATLLVKVAAEVAAGKRPEIKIFGSDYATEDGTCVRDYIHVEDLAEAHVKALGALAEGRILNEIFNCGYGHGSSVKAVIAAMKKVSGVEFPVQFEPRRAGDPMSLVANTDRIHAFLDWSPRLDSLEAICQSAYQWERSSLNKRI